MGKLSVSSRKLLDSAIFAAKEYIPCEFNRKMRSIADIAYWKASEHRLFLLYAGFVILNDRNILSKAQYTHFLKFAASMRQLISCETSNVNEVAANCQTMLKQFVGKSVKFYGSGFVSYNTHCLIHIVDDFLMFGSLDTISCFPFESFLGLLKSSLHSVNKPFQQICQRVLIENENALVSAKVKLDDFRYGKLKKKLSQSCKEGQASFAKVVLFNGCVVKRRTKADSTVLLHEAVYNVHDIFQDSEGNIYLALRKYMVVDNLFRKPVASKSIGVFKINYLSDDIQVLPLTNQFKKCVCLPHKGCMVAINILHSYAT